MSILLSDLVTRLSEDVPAEDGVPSTTQYENAIKDAVRDFSERCGLEIIATLSIVSGTATYDLPADFLKIIKVAAFAGQDVIQSASGLIPVPAGWCERYTIRNGQITFYPTPTYTVAKEIRYKAGWVGTDTVGEGSGYEADIEYETMGEREARIVLLKAQALALTKIANAQSSTAIKYSFGAVSEDLGSSSDTSRKNSNDIEREYIQACDRYNGTSIAFAGGYES